VALSPLPRDEAREDGDEMNLPEKRASRSQESSQQRLIIMIMT
jgi:hypothetical protein